MRTILMFHNCEGQSHKAVSTNHNLSEEKRRAEADSNRGPSAYQPNALPLGQTGSRGSCSALIRADGGPQLYQKSRRHLFSSSLFLSKNTDVPAFCQRKRPLNSSLSASAMSRFHKAAAQSQYNYIFTTFFTCPSFVDAWAQCLALAD